MNTLGSLLSANRDAILDAWQSSLVESGDERSAPLKPLARLEMSDFLGKLTAYFASEDAEITGPAIADIERQAAAISASRARDGFTPTATANMVLALKAVIGNLVGTKLMHQPAQLAACVTSLGTVIDRLALVTFAAYVETRERLIERQSSALERFPLMLDRSHRRRSSFRIRPA